MNNYFKTLTHSSNNNKLRNWLHLKDTCLDAIIRSQSTKAKAVWHHQSDLKYFNRVEAQENDFTANFMRMIKVLKVEMKNKIPLKIPKN